MSAIVDCYYTKNSCTTTYESSTYCSNYTGITAISESTDASSYLSSTYNAYAIFEMSYYNNAFIDASLRLNDFVDTMPGVTIEYKSGEFTVGACSRYTENGSTYVVCGITKS